MKRHGFYVREVDKNVILGIDRVRELIRKRQLFVFNTCKNVIDEFNSYRYDPEKPKEEPVKDNEPLDGCDQICDLQPQCEELCDARANDRACAAVSGHGCIAVISFKSRAQSVIHSDNAQENSPRVRRRTRTSPYTLRTCSRARDGESIS